MELRRIPLEREKGAIWLRAGMMKIVKVAAVSLLLAAGATAQLDRTLLEHWKYDQTAPLDFQQVAVRERDGVKIYDVTYTSPVDGRGKAVGPKGGTVAAYLVVPAGKGPFAAVVFAHWCMPGSEKKNRNEFLEEAVVLAQSGVLSLLPDHVIARPGF